MSRSVAHQTVKRMGAVHSPREAVQDRFLAPPIHQEDRPQAVLSASVGGSIQASKCVARKAGEGIGAIEAPRKTMQHTLLANRIKLEHRTHTGSATVIGCAVKIAFEIAHQARSGAGAVVTACEAVQDGLTAARVNFKHRSEAERAP